MKMLIASRQCHFIKTAPRASSEANQDNVTRRPDHTSLASTLLKILLWWMLNKAESGWWLGKTAFYPAMPVFLYSERVLHLCNYLTLAYTKHKIKDLASDALLCMKMLAFFRLDCSHNILQRLSEVTQQWLSYSARDPEVPGHVKTFHVCQSSSLGCDWIPKWNTKGFFKYKTICFL